MSLACVVLSSGGICSAAQALTVKKPLIDCEGTATGGPEPDDAILVACIDPEGAATTYEFKVVCRLREGSEECEGGEPPAGSGPLSGTIAAGYESQSVSVRVTGLKPGDYWWSVTATNSEGSTAWSKQGLVVAEVKTSEQPVNEAVRLGAERAVQEVREQQAREAAVSRVAEEAALKRRQEEQTAEYPVHVQRAVCIVPNVREDTLSVARRSLERAHCRLGQVSKSHRGLARLVVMAQSTKSGTTLPVGSKIAVTMGPVPHVRRRR